MLFLNLDEKYLDNIYTKYKTIEKEHQKIWNKKWFHSDILIEGDKEAQLATRFSIYHLIRSNNENDDRVAIDAKGVAGEAYLLVLEDLVHM